MIAFNRTLATKAVIALAAVALAAISLAASSLASSATAGEMSPVGRWKTIDDKTGAQTGVVEIAQAGDMLVGRIVKIIPEPGDPPDPVCKKCDGAEHNQRVLGLTILKGFKKDGDAWDGGTILDPRSGYVYSSEMHIGDGGCTLFVRGYLGISLLGRTTTWTRED